MDLQTIPALEHELTELVYAAILGETPWQSFLDRLNGILPAGASTLFFHDPGAKSGVVSLAAGIGEKEIGDYAAYYAPLNPWMQKVSETPLGVGIVGERIVPRDQFRNSEYYSDFLRPTGYETAVGITLFRDHGCSFLLSTLTSRDDPDTNQAAADLMTRLAPHLRRAFQYYRTGPLREATARFGASLLESQADGVIVLGEGRSVKALSRRAGSMLADGRVVGTTALGTIRIRDDAADAILRQMLRRDYEGERVRTMRIGRHSLALVRAELDEVSAYFAGPTVLLLIDPAQGYQGSGDPGWLAAHFRLSPAETRVAAGIVSGRSLTDIAERAGLSRETVRAQLKAVYAKTGVNSQAALVRLAIAGVPPD